MMSVTRQIEAAAAPTLKRIRDDRDRSPAQIQELLNHLEAHLFDPDLDATSLKIACGVRDNSISMLFHDAVSRPPAAYIEDCRMEVACRLLIDTDLLVWQIAQRLGYSTIQAFSRAFDRWAGFRPSVYRLQMRQMSSEAGTPNGTQPSWLRSDVPEGTSA